MEASTSLMAFVERRRENLLISMIEEAHRKMSQDVEQRHFEMMASNWAHQKRRLLDSVASSDFTGTGEPRRNHLTGMGKPKVPNGSRMDELQRMFASELQSAVLEGLGNGATLAERFQDVPRAKRDHEALTMWEEVVATCVAKPDNDEENVRLSIRFLENQFLQHVHSVVFTNLGPAEHGGVPGVEHIVRAYLNVMLPVGYDGAEDGQQNGHPVWALVFVALRMGRVDVALQIARHHGPELSEIASLLSELASSKDQRLTPQAQTKVRLQYRRIVGSSGDKFKRIVYSVLGSVDVNSDHGEVCDTIEHWLWLKLGHARNCIAPDQPDTLSLEDLRVLITKEHGESHFVKMGSPAIYFTCLWLTGQFELAVDFLHRQSLTEWKTHAVHVAMAAYQVGALNVPENVQAKLCTPDDDTSGEYQLNIARLILLYTSAFSHSDPREALLYFYFLKDFKTVKGENLFFASVSDLVLETREFEFVLGSLSEDGTYKRSLFADFGFSLDQVQEVIQHTAGVALSRGMVFPAARLYFLARNEEKSVAVLSRLLVQHMAEREEEYSSRKEIAAFARTVQRSLLEHHLSGPEYDSFLILMDLLTFFDLAHLRNASEAIEVMEALKLIPLSEVDVETALASFGQIPDMVRKVLPDAMLLIMQLLAEQVQGKREGRQKLETIARKYEGCEANTSRAILQFASRIPYQMSPVITSSLIHLDASI